MAVPMVAALAAALMAVGCDSGAADGDEYVEVCVDAATGVRVDEDDDRCDDDHDGPHWIYIPPGQPYPAVGEKPQSFVTQRPAGSRVYRPQGSGGGVRGGFGGRAPAGG